VRLPVSAYGERGRRGKEKKKNRSSFTKRNGGGKKPKELKREKRSAFTMDNLRERGGGGGSLGKVHSVKIKERKTQIISLHFGYYLINWLDRELTWKGRRHSESEKREGRLTEGEFRGQE